MRHATGWAIVLTIAVAAMIAALTLTPPMQVEMPAGSDKFSHLIAFAALASPLAAVRPRWSGVLFVVFTAYGAAIEIIQPYVGRSRELGDLVADMVGIGVGLGVGLLVRQLLSRMGDPTPSREGDTGPQTKVDRAEPDSLPRR